MLTQRLIITQQEFARLRGESLTDSLNLVRQYRLEKKTGVPPRKQRIPFGFDLQTDDYSSFQWRVAYGVRRLVAAFQHRQEKAATSRRTPKIALAKAN